MFKLVRHKDERRKEEKSGNKDHWGEDSREETERKERQPEVNFDESEIGTEEKEKKKNVPLSVNYHFTRQVV